MLDPKDMILRKDFVFTRHLSMCSTQAHTTHLHATARIGTYNSYLFTLILINYPYNYNQIVRECTKLVRREADEILKKIQFDTHLGLL